MQVHLLRPGVGRRGEEGQFERLCLPFGQRHDALGAQPETLSGLSGFGDLVLTCTSDQSRNYRYGFALGRGDAFDPTTTVEGAATARAVQQLAGKLALDMPICNVVAELTTGTTDVQSALAALLSRPLKEE